MSSKNKLIQLYKEYITTHSNIFDIKNGIRILSYNVQLFLDINGNSSFDKLEKLITDSNADVVLLYEAVNGKHKLEEIIKNKYKYVKYCNNYGINILLSKYPIDSCSVLRLSKDPVKKMNRYAIISNINVNNNIVKLAMCHLDVFDDTEETRLVQIKEILQKIDNEYIILGDLNSLRKADYNKDEWEYLVKDCEERKTKAHTLVTDYIESNGYTDAWQLIKKACPKITVWSMRRVDYIYIGKNFKYTINNCNLQFTDTSDHFPLYIDLKIN